MKEKPNYIGTNLEEILINIKNDENGIQTLNNLTKIYQPVDIAEVLNEFEEPSEVLTILNLANEDLKSNIFVELDFELQEYIVQNLDNLELKSLVKDIYSDDLIDIMDEVSTKVVEKILTAASVQKRQELNDILKNEEESAGANMAVDFIRFEKNLTVTQARTIIRKKHLNVENVDMLYVVDDYGTLVGEIQLKDLVINEPHKRLVSIMKTNFVTVQEKADQEEIVELFKKYDLVTLPVVNNQNKIIGIITSEDVIDVMEQEQAEDLEKFVGINPLDDDIFRSSVWKIFRSRIGWLTAGLLLATIIQLLLVVFLNAFNVELSPVDGQAFYAVYLLMPMTSVLIITTSIGSNQIASSFIRLISLNRYTDKELLKIISKEAIVSLMNLVVVLSFNILRLVIFYLGQFNNIQADYLWKVIGLSSLALSVGMFFGVIMGTLLPILLKKLKIDPAIISSPLITIVNGIISMVVFFGIGLLVL